MKEKIEKLSKGIFEYEMPKLIVSETEIDLTLESGVRREGTLRITNETGQRMKGILYVSGSVLIPEKMDFIGAECKIPYTIDASELLPREEHTGAIHVVSDCGECKIPFRITLT